MNITKENKVKKIYLEDIKICYRLPDEFKGLGNNYLKAITIWAFHYWKSNMCDIWQNIGFRILGLEFNLCIWY